MNNTTVITQFVGELAHAAQTGTAWWIIILAVMGAAYLLNSIARTGFSLVVGIAYLIGLSKFIFTLIKRKKQ